MTESDIQNASEHDWFADRIATALAGGLAGAEKDRFDAHALHCPACAALFAEAKRAEETVMGALADLRPPPGLEERIIRRRPSRYSIVYRATAAVAATIVLGAAGASVLMPSLNRARETANRVKLAAAQRQIDMLQSEVDGSPATPSPVAQEAAKDQSVTPTALPAPHADVPVLAAGEIHAPYLHTGAFSSAGSGEGNPAPGQKTSLEAGITGLSAFANPQVITIPSRGLGGEFGGGGFGVHGSANGAGQASREDGKLSFAVPAPSAKNAEPMAATPDESQNQNTPSGALPSNQSDIVPATQPAAISDRKIIRSGVMTFEVESFDAAYARLADIVRESGGYIGSTDSQRLPNEKVRGAVTLRVPPQNLDLLVLKLRALGDLKQQRIEAQDVTREYTDLQSQLRAAQAMQDRLLDLIHTAKGQVKDLLAVENELGVWRQKVEEVTGQINYYNNLVSLSTLQVTLEEKDIEQAAVIQTQTVNAGLEAEDVPRARDEVFKAVDAAKGRIVQADLNEVEAGQFMATLVAAIPPDAAEGVIDRIQQLGHVAHLQSSRQQTMAQDSPSQDAVLTGLRIEKRDTILNLTIYNLTAIAPQETDEITLLPRGGDLQAAYSSLLDFAASAGKDARLLDKDLQQQNGLFTSASIDMEVSRARLSQADDAIAAAGKIVNRLSTRHPDSPDVIDSKVLLKFSFVNVAALDPRRNIQADVSAADAVGAYQTVLDVAKAAGAIVRSAQLTVQTGQNIGGEMEFDLPSEKEPLVEQAVESAGVVMNQTTARAAENDATTDSRVRMHLRFTPLDQLAPRRTFTVQVQASNPQAASAEVISAALTGGGKVLQRASNTDSDGQTSAKLVLLVPLAQADNLAQQAAGTGTIAQNQSVEDPQAPTGAAARARLEIEFDSQPAVLSDDNGLWATVRTGWITSLHGLLWSLEVVMIGLCLLGPWALLVWIGWRLFRRARLRSVQKQ